MGRNTHRFQTNFTGGEADPKTIARGDVKFYYNACKSLENYEVLPQGGVRRRPGTAYSATLPGTINDLISYSLSDVAYDTGTVIGDITNKDALFDDTTSNQYTVPFDDGDSGYVGKDWGAGNTKTIHSATLYWEVIAFHPVIKITLQGSSDNFSSDINNLSAVTLALPSGTNPATKIVLASDTSTAYRYHRLKLETNSAGMQSYLFEVVFKEQTDVDTISATDPQGHGGTVANVIDDDETTICTTTALSTTDDYVVAVVDLTAAKSIRFVDVENIYFSGGSGETSNEFGIEYSSDNFASDVHTFGSNLDIVSETAASYRIEMGDQSSPSARYWRLIRNGTNDLGTSVVNVGSITPQEDLGATSETRLIPFEFNTEQTYMLVATDKNIGVYKDGALVTNVKSPYTSAQVGEINWTQSADTLIVVHEDVAPWTMQRDTSQEGIWNTAYLTLDYVPLYDYTQATTHLSNANDYITPSDTNGSITLTLAGSGGNLAWTSAHVGQLCEVNGGLARVTVVQSDTVVLAVVVVPMYTTDQDTDWYLYSGYVDVWSSTYGWPKSVCFFEGRLWFGGSKSRPHTLWGSQVDDFGNFNSGQGLANEALNVTLDTDQINAITQIYAGKDLQVFTTGAEFYLPQTLGEPITPSSIQVKRQTSRGSKQFLRVVEVEGGTMFIQRGGQGVREYLYNALETAYNAANIALLSSHLINDPVDFSLRRANETNEADQLLLVNTDGGMAVCCTLRDQNVTAWVPWSFTSASVKNAAAIRGGTNPVYLITERTINSTTARHLELMGDDNIADFGSTQTVVSTGSATIDSLNHLEGETIAVFINGVYQGTDTISSGSTLSSYSLTAGDSVEVGYSWVPSGETMPVEIDSQGGSIRARLKRPVEATFFLYDTDNISCNGNTQTVGNSTTGQIVFQGMTEYTKDGTITFSQSTPGTQMILGIDVEVSY